MQKSMDLLLRKLHDGPCTGKECDFNCTNTEFDPVCDTNSSVYRNLCVFQMRRCELQLENQRIQLAEDSKFCLRDRETRRFKLAGVESYSSYAEEPYAEVPATASESTTPEIVKSSTEKPVEEGFVTRITAKTSKQSFHDNFSAISEEICPRTCSRDVKPVCDEANNTHQNLCHFQQYNCNMRKLGIRSPYLRYLRPCVKNRKVDNAVENVEMRATVSSIEIKTTKTSTSTTVTPVASRPTVPSEKTTFIVSAFERVMKSTSTESPITTSSSVPTPTISPELTTALRETTTLSEVAYFDCPQPTCPTDGQPVCDSAGNLHGNLCEFTYSRCLAASRGHQIHIATEENCVSKEACQMPCTDDKHPICASDFSTYDNLCHFRKQKCLDPELEVLFKGKCNECLDSPCALPAENAPDESFVCLEDQSTKSLCEYQMLSCIFEKGYGVNLTVEYIGACCPPVESCDAEKPEPVCADNGVTFLSECEMNVENCKLRKLDQPKLVIVSRSVCEKDMLTDDFSNSEHFDKPSIEFKRENSFNCSMDCDNAYDPLCGTNGITYTNACSLQKEICDNPNSTVEVAYTGMCCDTSCPLDFSPVCDKHNVTVGEVLMKDYDGECCRTDNCDFAAFSPICDTEGVTHANECLMNRNACIQLKKYGKTVQVAYQGQCCYQPCEEEIAPVCDGTTTHSNTCQFRIAQCEAERVNKTLNIVYPGECCILPKGECETSGPVCDAEGQTHSNHCLYQQKRCIAQRITKKTLNIVHTGECCALASCPKTGQPVCDSMGRTHDSLCHFHNSKCIFDKIHSLNNTLNLDYQGKCCPSGCTDELSVTCDQHGNIYRNTCYFNLKACEIWRRTQDVLLATPCPLLRT
ncbi:unnamed protein product [Caenorhabditis sp. 36 PRJEB53466]|nr:unnamed protein product [Caenorhabditis sp. 36 PRJEB53466]